MAIKPRGQQARLGTAKLDRLGAKQQTPFPKR